jgi:hypothetical protein
MLFKIVDGLRLAVLHDYKVFGAEPTHGLVASLADHDINDHLAGMRFVDRRIGLAGAQDTSARTGTSGDDKVYISKESGCLAQGCSKQGNRTNGDLSSIWLACAAPPGLPDRFGPHSPR